jgi:hypothetical protein
MIVKKDSEKNIEPIIGHTNDSMTFIPYQALISENRSIWDIPGFGDAKGLYEELLHASCLEGLIKKVKKAKFVFVTSLDSICSSRGKPFIDNLTIFADTFDDITFLEGRAA